MKKLSSILIMFLALSVSAQQVNDEPKLPAETLSPSERASLQREIQHKRSQWQVNARQKTQGMVSQRMSHADIADMIYGNTLLRLVFSPFAPDSNYLQNFSTPDYINVHGFGQTFDPTSIGFDILGQPYFAKNDPYTIDTIYVGMRYRTASPVTGLTGDTLQVVAFMGDDQDNAVWRIGIGYSANTYPNQPSRINVLVPRYTGNPNIGTPGTINAPNKMVFKYALKASDTTLNYIKIVPTTPIQVPAGDKFGVFCTFIPGYTYDPATQFYYISGSKADVNNMSWLYLTRQNSSDNTPYFFEALNQGDGSAGLSNNLFSNTRYGSWTGSDAFRNEYPSPSTIRGNLIDFWVSGTSTVGLEEDPMDGELTLFPNPSSGKVSITVPSGGTYSLKVTSLTGQVVWTESLKLNDEPLISRDFSSLPQGIYLVSLTGEAAARTAKLTIR